MTGLGGRLWSVAVLGALAMSSSACVVATDPSASGAEPLAGSEDIRPHGAHSFFLSPNGHFIFYESNRGDDFSPVFVVYDVAAQQARDVAWSPAAAELARGGRGPRPSTCRWDASERAVVLEGDAVFFVVRLDGGSLEWEIAPGVGEFRLAEPGTLGSDGAITRRQPSDQEVLLADASDPSEVLARHTVDELGGTRVAIPYWTVSPSRRYLTYVVEGYRGTFLGPTRAYILNLTGGEPDRPRLLAAPVSGPLKWKADGSAFFACVRREGEPYRIFRWPSPS